MTATTDQATLGHTGAADRDEEVKRLQEELARARAELAGARAQLHTALEQQTATGEVLRAVAESPASQQRVLDRIVESLATLCEAHGVSLMLVEGEAARLVARAGENADTIPVGTLRPLRLRGVTSAALHTRRTVHIADMKAEADRFPDSRAQTNLTRTNMAVPMLDGDEAIGALILYRTEVRPFSDTQVRLAETFAAQAAIAVRNARLFSALNESNATLQEALEQQTATGEVLRAVAESPTGQQQVLDRIVTSLAALCDAQGVTLVLVEGAGDLQQLVAKHGSPDALPLGLVRPLRMRGLSGVAMHERRTIHVLDIKAEAARFPESSGHTAANTTRTNLSVPLLDGDRAIGALIVARTEVRAFTETQVRLAETFASQAVVAIRNARLFNELQEENTRKQRELERARTIQQRLLPDRVPAWPGNIEVAYRFQAAVETSGDFYDIVLATPTTPDDVPPLLISVADTAGKGMGAALVMSLARAGLRHAASSPYAIAPAGIARAVGDRLHRDVGSGAFVACALATLEAEGDRPYPRLRLVNAGQVPVLLCRNGAVQELEPPGSRFPLGAVAGCLYQEVAEQLRPGDVVVFCTDGLPEAPWVGGGWGTGDGFPPAPTTQHLTPPSSQAELFGFERLAQSAARWSQVGESADAVAGAIWADVTAWAGEQSHHDDMTLLVLRVPTS